MARDFERAVPAIPRVVRRDFESDLGVELADIFRTEAPYGDELRNSFHMADTIDANVASGGGIRLNVEVDAVDPGSGYDYLDVTRYGHAGPITVQTRKTLRWPYSASGYVFAKQSAGSHVGRDWVDTASLEADRALDASENRIGRVIETVVLG